MCEQSESHEGDSRTNGSVERGAGCGGQVGPLAEVGCQLGLGGWVRTGDTGRQRRKGPLAGAMGSPDVGQGSLGFASTSRVTLGTAPLFGKADVSSGRCGCWARRDAAGDVSRAEVRPDPYFCLQRLLTRRSRDLRRGIFDDAGTSTRLDAPAAVSLRLGGEPLARAESRLLPRALRHGTVPTTPCRLSGPGRER